MTERDIKHRRNLIEHAKKLVYWAPEKIKPAYRAYLERLEDDLKAKLNSSENS